MIADAGRAEDCVEGAVRIVELAGREVGLVRWDGEFYAVRNVCPHQAGPVCAGLVRPHIISAGRPGVLDVEPETPVLACPWHGWEFDVRTGRSLLGGRERVRTYAVNVEGGRLKVDLGGRRR